LTSFQSFFGNQNDIFMIAHFAPYPSKYQLYSGVSLIERDKSSVYTDSMQENTISTKIFIYSKINENYNPFRWEVDRKWLQQRNRPQKRPQQKNPP